MRDIASSNAKQFIKTINRSDLSIEFKNGCWFYVYGAERPEQIRGDGFDLLVADESDDPNFTEALFDEVIGPALADQLGRLVQIGSPKGRGRLYAEWCRGQPDNDNYDASYASIQVTAVEAGIISQAEIERARRMRPERAFKQEFEANFNAPNGIIYEEWYEKVHLCDEPDLPDAFDEIIVGADWGTSNRGSMLVIGLDRVWVPPFGGLAGFEAARAWILEEHTHAGMGYDDGGWWAVAREIQGRWQPKHWYCDPAGGVEGYIRQLGNALKGGGRAHAVPADNEVRPGIATVREFMHHSESLGEPPRMRVMRACETFRDEVASYRFRKHRSKEDDFTEEPVKENDHCCFVGATLVETDAGPVPINRIKVGDLVRTRAGLRHVLMTHDNGVRPVWRLHMSDGSTLDATPEHRIWTVDFGWQRLDALRYGTKLFRCPSPTQIPPSESSLTVSPTVDTLSHRDWPIEATSLVHMRPENQGACIVQSGSTITGQSRSVGTFTTKTETRSITRSAILSALMAASTLATICENAIASIQMGWRHILSIFSLAPPNGTAAALAASGTLDMLNPPGLSESHPANGSRKHAGSALRHLKLSAIDPRIDSARTPARVSGEGSLASTTLRQHASTAAPYLDATNIKQGSSAPVAVVRVEDTQIEERVYCLTVDEHHEFFANGILVKNCDAVRYALHTHFSASRGRRRAA